MNMPSHGNASSNIYTTCFIDRTGPIKQNIAVTVLLNPEQVYPLQKHFLYSRLYFMNSTRPHDFTVY